MKRVSVALLLCIVIFSSAWAGGGQEKSEPSAEGPITIKIVAKDITDGTEENVQHFERMEKAFREATGISVDFEQVPISEGSYAEGLNLLILGGDIPDLIYFQGNDQAIANKGLLEDLTPYIASSPVIQDAMLDFNKKRLASYPYLLWLAPPRIRVPVIRSDWYEKAGIEPVTVDEYYAMLKKIVESDFDGNGKIDSMGITDTGNTTRTDFIFNHAFGVTSTWLKKDGKYVYSRVSEEEKNKLAFYRKLYAEGILDPEYITTKWDTMEDKLFSAKVGMIGGTAGLVVDIYEGKMKKSAAGGKLVALPPAKGVSQGFTIDVTKETRGWAIYAGSKVKKEAWAFLEFMASNEGQIVDRLGFEGVHHRKEGDKYILADRFSEWWPRVHEVVEWKSPAPLFGETASKSREIGVKYTKEDINFVLPKELATTWDALNNLYKEYSFNLISGQYSMDAFDEYVEKWYEIGGDKLTEYANKVLK